jgi:hypothetical protein
MLTGRTMHRLGFNKKLILQVEVGSVRYDPDPRVLEVATKRFRDATIEDLQELQEKDNE